MSTSAATPADMLAAYPHDELVTLTKPLTPQLDIPTTAPDSNELARVLLHAQQRTQELVHAAGLCCTVHSPALKSKQLALARYYLHTDRSDCKINDDSVVVRNKKDAEQELKDLAAICKAHCKESQTEAKNLGAAQYATCPVGPREFTRGTLRHFVDGCYDDRRRMSW